jgi:hypothetical protein
MKIVNKGKTLIVVGGIFLGVCIGIVFILIRIGGAYRSGLDSFSASNQISDVTHTERQKIRKITIKNLTNPGCMEVTPDGIIRIFTTCGEELSDARRVTDTKYILQLYKKMAETDLSTLPEASDTPCDGYSMILETDSEKRSVCLQTTSDGNTSSGGNTGGGGIPGGGTVDEIIKIIDQVIDNIPPTPTSTPDPIAPTAPSGASITVSPTDVVVPIWGSTPTPTIGSSRPFVCDFLDAKGKKRPYTISNIICSTEPSQAPTPTP